MPGRQTVTTAPSERERPAGVPAHRRRTLYRCAAGLLTLGVFLVDVLTTLEGAVAVLYVVAVLLVARTGRRADIIVTALAGIVLTLAAYVDSHGLNHVGSQTFRALVSLAAIGITAVLALQHQHAMQRLRAQATLLDLSHDMIFVRDRTGVITFWNRTAAQVYGWSAAEAVGCVADTLLATRYPQARESVEAALLAQGTWEGTLEQRTRDGDWRVLDSRWVIQRDAQGRAVGVLETHTDVTERTATYAALVRSERRYRRMFDASRIGVVQEDWSALRVLLDRLGIADPRALQAHLADHPEFIVQARQLTRIADVNPAFVSMVQGRDGQHRDLASLDDVLDRQDPSFAAALAAFVAGDAFHEGETEVVAADGRSVPVLFAITFPSVDDDDACVLVFIVDNSERRQAQDAALRAQAELAHAARVATLGELTASLAHEVNQPLMAVVTNGEAGLRWLHRDIPDLPEVGAAIARTVSEARRASEIVKRVRSFLAKRSTPREALAVGTLIEESVRLVQHELSREAVVLRVAVAADLPPVLGDAVQLQQVLVNLLINASQAMAGQAGGRHLLVDAQPDAAGQVAISVTDTGPGIDEAHLDTLFQPFFTTKAQGMGMGLAICRSTAEAHGGHLTVHSAPGRGATFRLVLGTSHAGELLS
jgi:PAS domain S-box-containing protein